MCSCGQTEPHVIASKTTADGKTVEIHSDGYVTGVLGYLLPGVGRRRLPERALWAFAGDVCLYTLAEIPGLVKEHQKAPRVAKPLGPEATGIRFVPYARSIQARLLHDRGVRNGG